MSEKSFEMPDAMRDVAEQSLNQAKSAYDQFLDASRQAQEMMEQSSGAMLESAREIHAKSLAFAQENMKAGFDLADRLVKAKDVGEALEIQNSFAQKQMEAYSRQAKELTEMMSKAAKKAQES